MSNGGGENRVSAFAKRKRLHDDPAKSTPEREPEPASIAQPPKKRAKPPTCSSPAILSAQRQSQSNEQQQSRVTGSVNMPSIASVLAEAEEAPEVNSFEPLVEHKKVTFSGIRQIERVGQTDCKVRLSRDRVCSGRRAYELYLTCIDMLNHRYSSTLDTTRLSHSVRRKSTCIRSIIHNI